MAKLATSITDVVVLVGAVRFLLGLTVRVDDIQLTQYLQLVRDEVREDLIVGFANVMEHFVALECNIPDVSR